MFLSTFAHPVAIMMSWVSTQKLSIFPTSTVNPIFALQCLRKK